MGAATVLRPDEGANAWPRCLKILLPSTVKHACSWLAQTWLEVEKRHIVCGSLWKIRFYRNSLTKEWHPGLCGISSLQLWISGLRGWSEWHRGLPSNSAPSLHGNSQLSMAGIIFNPFLWRITHTQESVQFISHNVCILLTKTIYHHPHSIQNSRSVFPVVLLEILIIRAFTGSVTSYCLYYLCVYDVILFLLFAEWHKCRLKIVQENTLIWDCYNSGLRKIFTFSGIIHVHCR